jgi:hypothetical protein
MIRPTKSGTMSAHRHRQQLEQQSAWQNVSSSSGLWSTLGGPGSWEEHHSRGGRHTALYFQADTSLLRLAILECSKVLKM